MPKPQHARGVQCTLVGWVIQTAGFAVLVVVWWQYQESVIIAQGAPVVIPQGQLWSGVALTVVGTGVLAAGLGMVAQSKGHSRLFAALAPTWLASLLLVGLLPDLFPQVEETRLKFECPQCGAITYIEMQFAGQQGPCRKCGELVRVPGMLTRSDVTDQADIQAEAARAKPPIG